MPAGSSDRLYWRHARCRRTRRPIIAWRCPACDDVTVEAGPLDRPLEDAERETLAAAWRTGTADELDLSVLAAAVVAEWRAAVEAGEA